LNDFYATVDAAVVPMSFSTGLKIKVSEALALGLPVIAHAHAFEGFKSRHPAQVLPDFEQIANTCVDVAYDPPILAQMAVAAQRSQAALEMAVSAGFGRTARILASYRPRLLILAKAADLDESGLQGMWLASCLPFLSAAANVTLLVCGDEEAEVSRAGAKFRQTGVAVIGYPGAQTSAGEQADRISEIRGIVRETSLTFVISDIISAMPALPLAEMHVCIVLDVLGFGAPPSDVKRHLSSVTDARRISVLASGQLTPDHLQLETPLYKTPKRRDYGIVPLFSERYLEKLHRSDRTSSDLEAVFILSPDANTDLVAIAIERLLAELRPSLNVAIVRRCALRENEFSPEHLLQRWRSGLRVDLIIDLGPGAPYTAALRELAHRRGAVFIDRLSFSSVENYSSDMGFNGLADRLLQVLSAAASGAEILVSRTEYDNEAGWAWLWRFISELPAPGAHG
jgi:hypothetical protein